MIPPDEPIHPATVVLLGLALAVAMLARITLVYGVGVAAILVIAALAVAALAWVLYEVTTMHRDSGIRR